jgi:hypothetical protein
MVELETNHGVSVCATCLFVVLCAGVEHRGSQWAWRRSS